MAEHLAVGRALAPLRDEGEAYAALLEKQGVEVDLTRYASMVHGFIHFVDVGRECPAYVRELSERAGATLRVRFNGEPQFAEQALPLLEGERGDLVGRQSPLGGGEVVLAVPRLSRR